MTVNQLRRNSRIEHIDDERNIGNGIIVTLKKGWSFDQLQDNRVAGEDMVTAAKYLVGRAYPFAGPFTN